MPGGGVLQRCYPKTQLTQYAELEYVQIQDEPFDWGAGRGGLVTVKQPL